LQRFLFQRFRIGLSSDPEGQIHIDFKVDLLCCALEMGIETDSTAIHLKSLRRSHGHREAKQKADRTQNELLTGLPEDCSLPT
jgi:hypothetical protein